MQHIYNGNMNGSDDITLVQINSGNSSFKNSMDRILNTVNDTKAKIVIVSEANMVNNAEHISLRSMKFPNFKFEDKMFNGNNNARLSILIHEEVEYVREKHLENEINCAIVIKIKRKKKKWANLIGVYRQWTGTAPGYLHNSCS